MLRSEHAPRGCKLDPAFVRALCWMSVAGCLVFTVSILIADFVVPNHDWVADTISDLGAGRYEYIVDIGIYAFAGSLTAIAMLVSHVHISGWRWSLSAAGFALLGLIVFLVGARNEYGDADSDGVVIHIYLVYAIGALMTLLPWGLAQGAAQFGNLYRRLLLGLSIVWTVSAPVFFLLPTHLDGLYERYLGVIAFSVVFTLTHMFSKAVTHDDLWDQSRR